LFLQEVWDKDPLSQERMGQLAFTTEKLKDLGMVRKTITLSEVARNSRHYHCLTILSPDSIFYLSKKKACRKKQRK